MPSANREGREAEAEADEDETEEEDAEERVVGLRFVPTPASAPAPALLDGDAAVRETALLLAASRSIWRASSPS